MKKLKNNVAACFALIGRYMLPSPLKNCWGLARSSGKVEKGAKQGRAPTVGVENRRGQLADRQIGRQTLLVDKTK